MLKNLKNNKKGFTLIELLAVIVILAILVMVAIPAVTKYLNTSREGAFADTVNTVIDTARNNCISGVDGNSSTSYDKNRLNNLLSKKLNNSPWGATYEVKGMTVSCDGDDAAFDGTIHDGKHCIEIPKTGTAVDRSEVGTCGGTDCATCTKPSKS